MVTDAVLQYMRDSLAAGKTEEVLTETLVNAGWKPEDVASALATVKSEQLVSPPLTSSQPTPSQGPTTQTGEPVQAQPAESRRNPYANFPTYTGKFLGSLQRPQENKKSRGAALSIAVLALLLVGLGSAAAHFGGIIQLPFFDPNPEKVFKEGLLNVADIRRASYTLQVSLRSEAKDSGTTPIIAEETIRNSGAPTSFSLGAMQGNLTLKTSGTFDANATANTNARSRISIAGTVAGVSGDADFEILKKNSVYYVRLHSTRIPEELSVAGGLPNLSPIIGKWIKITPADIQKFQGVGAGISGVIPLEFPDKESNRADDEKIMDNIRRILLLLIEEKVFAFGEKPRKETLGDASVFHYNIKVQGGNIPNLYKRITAEFASSTANPLFPSMRFDQKVYDGLAGQEFQKFINRLNQNMAWEKWIDIATKFIAKTSLSIKILPLREATTQYRLTVASEIADVNQPITIAEPMDSIPFIDALDLIDLGK